MEEKDYIAEETWEGEEIPVTNSLSKILTSAVPLKT